MKEKSNVEPRVVTKEKAVPKSFFMDVPIPPGMKLDHFRADGTACFMVDPTTRGPKIPSKTHPVGAKKDGRGID